jgi:hypothetical protein
MHAQVRSDLLQPVSMLPVGVGNPGFSILRKSLLEWRLIAFSCARGISLSCLACAECLLQSKLGLAVVCPMVLVVFAIHVWHGHPYEEDYEYR